MRITREQATDRVTRYMTERLIPSAANTASRFKLGFVLPLVPQMVEKYWEMCGGLGISDAEHFDTERLAECLQSGMRQSESLTIQGFKFSALDVKEFISYLDS